MTLNIPEYSDDQGFKFDWEPGFEIESSIENGVIKITANKAGLISLAKHLLNLSQDQIPAGYHLHFDETNALEDGSSEFILEKK
ncbi:hypothetical protein B0O44_104530 [Pedobacter nutrimenti]|uniref:Uncharacterized protein n=2 Tax=Pedobacter nutrimenti TaxID=1241337 RepID=A0A318US12_9SPHI|nr:hypothetical protein B0O44_104530 [Pedobacter nutrimenti]